MNIQSQSAPCRLISARQKCVLVGENTQPVLSALYCPCFPPSRVPPPPRGHMGAPLGAQGLHGTDVPQAKQSKRPQSSPRFSRVCSVESFPPSGAIWERRPAWEECGKNQTTLGQAKPHCAPASRPWASVPSSQRPRPRHCHPRPGWGTKTALHASSQCRLCVPQGRRGLL